MSELEVIIHSVGGRAEDLQRPVAVLHSVAGPCATNR